MESLQGKSVVQETDGGAAGPRVVEL